MERKELGRISAASFGWGGYQDAMIGLHLQFEGPSWGCTKFDGAWGIERSDRCQWSEDDRLRELGEAVMRLRGLLKDAKANDVAALIGKPVECVFESNTLKSFRILKEVL